MPDLFVIEAPGKAKHIQEILKSVGIDARVQATKGHLYSMPDRLTPVGIDSGFREFERKLREPEIGQRIRDEAANAERVFIATDADEEGDVIAWDVAELIADIQAHPLRVRLRGMDEESVLESIEGASNVLKRDAIAGRTRAIVDRMIGSVFSRDGVAVGRVGTALLGLVQKEEPPVVRLRLVAPAKEGRPWVADCDVKAPLDFQTAKKLEAVRFPVLDASERKERSQGHPGNLADIMVSAGDKMDMSPKEAATSMQRLYEAGRVSYPRANSRGISRSVLRKVAKALQKSGYKFDENIIPDKPDTDVHDAPYPIGRTEIARDPVKQGHDEGLRTLIARDMIKSGQVHELQFGVGERAGIHLKKMGFSEEVATYVSKLEWRREVGPQYPGQETWPESKVTVRRADTVLLQHAVEAGLGKPSTWANHIDKFMSRGLVDEDLNLTRKGKEWIAASPPALLDPRISAAIEQACDRVLKGMMDDPDREPWEILSEKIINALPDQLKKPLMNAVEKTPPHPKPDPIAPYRETVGLENILENAKDKAFNYGPRGPEAPSQ
ncbi:DNA topoisomerase [Mesorhizobium sp. SP-1A]|uniref:DNA topoisomerase n=1 Tax=Mesorhizobium sp. SP-1A TaxID=3077840 RepID=UPI0028F727B3|nr:DNA topoisomerase [Mesorhizobium sp. SP-1A]